MASENEILVRQGGLQTIVVDWPGRVGQWGMGIPPSGPADDLAFRMGNRLLGNRTEAAGLEVQFVGPTLEFRTAAEFCVSGAPTPLTLNGEDIPMWTRIVSAAGDVLRLGACTVGARCYLTVTGGLDVPAFLGSRSTFVKAALGPYDGRGLAAGDSLGICGLPAAPPSEASIPVEARPVYERSHVVEVLAGPHDDRLSEAGFRDFLDAEWSVLAASDRTGIRLSGPSIGFREDLGGDGMHPSNVVDFSYSVGSVSLSGDTPIIYPVDGPSLGGFMCPFTIVRGAIWKSGQVRPGDKVRFAVVDDVAARDIRRARRRQIDGGPP